MSSVTMTVSQVRDSGGSHRDSSSRERQELGKQGPGREPWPPESQLVAAGKFTSGGGGGRLSGGTAQAHTGGREATLGTVRDLQPGLGCPAGLSPDPGTRLTDRTSVPVSVRVWTLLRPVAPGLPCLTSTSNPGHG